MVSSLSLESQFRTVLSDMNKMFNISGKVYIGFNSKPHRSGVGTAELARMLNYGTETIPDRPLLTRDFPFHLSNSKKLPDFILGYIENNALLQVGKRTSLEVFGIQIKQEFIDYVWTNPYGAASPNNAKYVKYRKKFNFPWVWTGELMDSFDFQVEE